MQGIGMNQVEQFQAHVLPIHAIRMRFIRNAGFVPWAIVEDTNSLMNHVEFGTRAGTWIGAHLKGGVMERPADYCEPVWVRYYEIPCTAEEEAEFEARLRSQIGIPYNTLDIFGLLLRNRRWTNPHRVICSQFVCDNMLWKYGTEWLNVENAYTYLITPEMDHLSPMLAGRLKYSLG